MRLLFLCLAVLLNTIGFAQSNTEFYDRADAFFKTYTQNGRVNYSALRKDQDQLNWLINYLENTPVEKAGEKAYLINAYNLYVIKQVVKQPTLPKKPTDVAGFFDKKSLTLNGKKVSLNQIENEMLRPVYKDPRIHFVLVCAGLGCPPIVNFAYRPESLDDQMNKQTIKALNDSKFVFDDKAKKTIFLSQIFEWYQSDFGSNSKASITYINKFRKRAFNKNDTVIFYPYDWSLNSAIFPIIQAAPIDRSGGQSVPPKDAPKEAPKVAEVKTEPAPAPKTEEIKIAEIKIAETVTNEIVPEKIAEPVKQPEIITITIQDSIIPDVSNSESIKSSVIIENTSSEPELNIQTFTSGALLGKGRYDFTLFNTIYTEKHQDWKGQELSGYRATFVTHLMQVTYGLTKSKRINIGFDINFRSNGRAASDDKLSAISRAFAYKNTDSTRVGITSLGARLKVQPFGAVPHFTIQSTLFSPTIKHPEGYSSPNGSGNLYWADWDRITWWNQLFYDKTFSKYQIFAELDFLFRFKRFSHQIGSLDMPMSVFFSYFPNSKLTLYGMTQHVPRFTNNINGHKPEVTDWVIPMNYTASGLGIKYALIPNLNLELLYTNFWRGQNSGLGATMNVGIKYITQ